MTKTLQYIKDLVINLSPADMTELIQEWLKIKDARFVFSLEWKPQSKLDMEGKEDSVWTTLTKGKKTK